MCALLGWCNQLVQEQTLQVQEVLDQCRGPMTIHSFYKLSFFLQLHHPCLSQSLVVPLVFSLLFFLQLFFVVNVVE